MTEDEVEEIDRGMEAHMQFHDISNSPNSWGCNTDCRRTALKSAIDRVMSRRPPQLEVVDGTARHVKVTCPGCCQSRALRVDGVMRAHRIDGEPCPGSGMRILDPIKPQSLPVKPPSVSKIEVVLLQALQREYGMRRETWGILGSMRRVAGEVRQRLWSEEPQPDLVGEETRDPPDLSAAPSRAVKG